MSSSTDVGLMSDPQYLTTKEAADFTRFTAGTLRNMRSEGRGPRFRRVGKAVRYRVADLIEWMESAA